VSRKRICQDKSRINNQGSLDTKVKRLTVEDTYAFELTVVDRTKFAGNDGIVTHVGLLLALKPPKYPAYQKESEPLM
jgi:hypothetical protein